MTRHYRHKMPERKNATGYHACPCGKRGYPSRRVAKSKAAELAADETRPCDMLLAPYRCDATTWGLWHIGHRKVGPDLNNPALRFV